MIIQRPSFIWPQHYCWDLAAYPSTPFPVNRKDQTSRFLRWFTWHYSTQGLPINCIAATNRELLPHVFTLIPNVVRDGNFLWHYLYPSFWPTSTSSVLQKLRSRPLAGVLPFAVRTFLPYW